MPIQEWTETIGSSLSEDFVRMWIPAYHHKINHLVIVIANDGCTHPSQNGLADTRCWAKTQVARDVPSYPQALV
jgi:hypothetical protein